METDTPSKKYILLAEDEEAYARVLIYKLTQEGFEVVHESNGERALQAARQRTPMIILLDIMIHSLRIFR